MSVSCLARPNASFAKNLLASPVYNDKQETHDNIKAAENLIEKDKLLIPPLNWSERFHGSEVRTEDRALIVTAITDVPELWSVMVAQKDLIFFHR